MKSHFKDISRQLIENSPGNKMNVIFGGGRDFMGASLEEKFETVKFSGAAQDSCNRTDKINLAEKYLERFENDNETVAKYVTNTGELMDALSDVHHLDYVLGLFANNHMSYNSLRNKESGGEPSLTEMTKAAIRILGTI
jgi:alkaline phosphatase